MKKSLHFSPSFYLLTFTLFLGSTLLHSKVMAQDLAGTIQEEMDYTRYQQRILRETAKSFFIPTTPKQQKIYLDALEDLLEESEQAPKSAYRTLRTLNTFFYSLPEKLRAALLQLKHQQGETLDPNLVEEVRNELLQDNPEKRIIYLIAQYAPLLRKIKQHDLVDLGKKHASFFDLQTEDEDEDESNQQENELVLQDLLYQTPDTTTYMNGEYINSVKLFMFCRKNRLYPCLMVMKDQNNQLATTRDSDLWTHPALASSSRGLPSYVRNGHTPAGVYTIDSVMPLADQIISFGRFRRLILNFIPPSENEVLLKSLLPESSHDEIWWRPSVVARDIGRNLLRIHGTGKINTDPHTPYFPFMRTSGCVAQRENTYKGIRYIDQRLLLDSMMGALGLEPRFENEVKIKGFLYVIELNDIQGAVTKNDIEQLLHH